MSAIQRVDCSTNNFYFASHQIVSSYDEKVNNRDHSTATGVDNAFGWPSGSYGIPMATSGCQNFGQDKTTTTNRGGGYIVRKVNMSSFDEIPDLSYIIGHSDYFKENICVHTSGTQNSSQSSLPTATQFPPGRYCVYKHKTEDCPSGFSTSGLNFQEQILEMDSTEEEEILLVEGIQKRLQNGLKKYTERKVFLKVIV